MERLYTTSNTTATSTTAPVKQPTGTAIRTMLQLKVPTTSGIWITAWGISFDGSAAATPIQCELFGCTGAATMSTALVAADLMGLNQGGILEASTLVVGGTANSAFATGAVTEGTVANYHLFDEELVAPTGQYVEQFPLGREPYVPSVYAATQAYLRVRVTAGASVNAYVWVQWGE